MYSNNLKKLFQERIVSGLRRSSLTKCSQWAETYRVMPSPFPGKWKWEHHPWLKAMHDSEAHLNVGQKSAQMGYTETVLNLAFFTLDIKGRDVLYVLPAQRPDATVFTASRFNPALELSPHLKSLFSDVDNVEHKRAGTRNLFIRGSHSRGSLKSIPVYLIILDEVNEMTQDNIPLALERTSGQTDYMHWMLSTPTIDDEGINRHFKRSTQNHFFFKCPHCTRYIEFNFPDDLIITADDINDPRIEESYYICNQCKAVLHHEDKIHFLNTDPIGPPTTANRSSYPKANGSQSGNGKINHSLWVPTFKDRESEGWYINQFYSMAKAGAPSEIAKLAITARSNKADEQEFYNSKGGLVHAVEGSQLTDTEINSTIGSYTKATSFPRDSPSALITMGVDQGRWIHYVIDQWVPRPKAPMLYGPLGGLKDLAPNDLSLEQFRRMISFGKVLNFEQLDLLMQAFRVTFCVIDSQPERRKATEFSNRFAGHVRLCFYPEGLHAKQIHISDTGGEPQVSVDRTTWLDTSLGRFRDRSVSIPLDTDHEFKQHLKAPIRIYQKDRWGNPIGRYSHSTDDHYAHACTYSEVALHLASGIGKAQNIKRVF